MSSTALASFQSRVRAESRITDKLFERADVGDAAGERDRFAKGRTIVSMKYVAGCFTSPSDGDASQWRDFYRWGPSYARVCSAHRVRDAAATRDP